MSQRGPTGIYWGELPCRESFTATRTLGWEPAVYTVRCLASDAVEWLVKHDPKRFADLGKNPLPPMIASALADAAPKRFVPREKTVPYRANLFVRELRENAPALELPVRDLFLTEARVVDTLEPYMVELVLVDVRKFWGDYGELTQDFNVSLGVDAAGKVVYSPRSLVFGADPWKASTHVQRCLNALPGEVRLAYFPPFRDPVSRSMKCVGASALEVGKQVAADARLLFGLNLDGTAALWPVGGIGALGETPLGVGTFNSATYDPKRGEGAWKGDVVRNLLGRRVVHNAPDQVVVVGPPPVQTIRIDYLEPVLPYDEPQADGGSVRRLLPVTPALLEDLVRVFSSPTFRGTELEVDALAAQDTSAATTNFVLRTGPGLRLAGLPLANPAARLAASAPTSEEQRAYILRAPFLGDDWPPAFGFLPRALRDLVRDRLWRFWRVPARWSRFLEVLDRAERVNGRRLAPVVEAFSYLQVTATVDAAEKLEGVAPDTRTEDERVLQEVEGRLGQVRQQIDAQNVNLKDLQQASDEITKSLPRIREIASTLERQGLPANAAAVAAAAGFLPKSAQVANALAQKAPALLAAALGLQRPEDFDPYAKSTAELRTLESQLLAQRANLLEKTNPLKAAEDKRNALVKAIEAQQATAGTVDLGLELELAKAEEEVRAARAAKPIATKRQVTVLRHTPAPRGPVTATVDSSGLIESEQPLGWPSRMGQADLRETYLIPLPVALTFGSHALPDARPAPKTPDGATEAPSIDPPLPEGTVSDNPFVQAGVDLLTTDEAMRFYAADLGHIVPREPGAPLRLTYTREDRSGKATVDPVSCYRVTLRGDDPRGQVLVEMRKSTSGEVERVGNLDEVRAHAKGIVDALFALPQVVDAGSIEVLGPRPVNVDSKSTAVRLASDGNGNVNTTVYVDPEVEAVPGFPVDLPPANAGPAVFGVDTSGGLT